jgi:hypothetical protein
VGRRRKAVDETKLRNLALIGCSNEKIAQVLGVSRDTLERRYRAQIEEARGDGETKVLAKIFQAAVVNGNMRALELSAINRCGWANKPELVVNVSQTNAHQVDAADVRARLVRMHESIRNEIIRQNNGDDGPPNRFEGLLS